MNVYEAINTLLSVAHIEGNAPDVVAAGNVVAAMLDAYDALAPDWADAPDWAQWYVIDADDEATWYAKEPAYDRDGWHVIGVTNVSYCEAGELPLGIDWRLCKWSREGAK